MNFCVILMLLLILQYCNAMNLRTFESAVDQNSLLTAKGLDIIKFLNLNEVQLIQNASDVQEAEILKHKSKRLY